MKRIYVDYNATTPLDKDVLEAMLPHLRDYYGNPSSIHRVGREARAFLDEYRYDIADLWQCRPSEIVFTSGGTESNNLAIFGTARLRKDHGRHLICSAIEHHAVLHCYDSLAANEGFEVTYIPVDSEGRVDPEEVARAIRNDTQLVSVMAANNETGVLQPVAQIGSLCKDRGVLFHTDAVQWFGKEPVSSIHQFQADLVSICGHKLHGPKGSGALFIRSPLLPEKILFGGAHENERRAGTENLAAIAGLAYALGKFTQTPIFQKPAILEGIHSLRKVLDSIEGVETLSPLQACLCNTLAFTVAGCDSISLLAGLDLEGICASSGSACSVGSLEPSHVVTAMGRSLEQANALVRFSLGRENVRSDLDMLSSKLPEILRRCSIVKKGPNKLGITL
ncbi:MAG: cysteine desulfurase family protein [Verrucomicrobiota bacterium]|nr:cysteine desulfurase family protein [Verrucomicrobiota bacterium]